MTTKNPLNKWNRSLWSNSADITTEVVAVLLGSLLSVARAKARHECASLTRTTQGIRSANNVIRETTIDPMTGKRVTRTNEREDTVPYRGGSGFFNSPRDFQQNDFSVAGDEPRWWSRLKGFFSGDEDQGDYQGSGFIKQNNNHEENRYIKPFDQTPNHFEQRNFGRRMDPFDDFGSINPFRMMREFERMFQDEFDFQDHHSEFSRPQNDDFFGGFFGFGDDPRFSNFNEFRQSPFHHHQNQSSRFFTPDQGSANFYRPNQGPNNLNFPQQEEPRAVVSEPEPQIETAAARAKAKIYDV